MTSNFHHYHHPGSRLTWGLFFLTCGRAALLGGFSLPVVGHLFLPFILLFVLVLSKLISSFILNVFLLSFLLVAFAVDFLWRWRVKSWSRFWQEVRVIYSIIRSLHANVDELAVPGSDYVFVCAEPRVSDRRHLSELLIPGFGCPHQRLRNSTPGAQGMALYVTEGFRSFRQSKLECSHHEPRTRRFTL